MRFSSMLCALCLVLALGAVPLLGTVVLAQHGGWTDNYQDAQGTRCCTAQRDCWPTTGRLLTRDGMHVQVEIQGVPPWLPEKSIHASEDGAFWVCLKGPPEEKRPLTSERVRCVFYATGG